MSDHRPSDSNRLTVPRKPRPGSLRIISWFAG
jgi:hypothetical protein